MDTQRGTRGGKMGYHDTVYMTKRIKGHTIEHAIRRNEPITKIKKESET